METLFNLVGNPYEKKEENYNELELITSSLFVKEYNETLKENTVLRMIAKNAQKKTRGLLKILILILLAFIGTVSWFVFSELQPKPVMENALIIVSNFLK
jgi:hypothetical protein